MNLGFESRLNYVEKQKSVADARRERAGVKATLAELVQGVLSVDLIVQERPYIYLETPKEFWGLCMVASEAMYFLTDKTYRPMYDDQYMHWWLEAHPEGSILDLTSQYFESADLDAMYAAGKPFEFGDTPSETAKEIIRRVERWL